MVCRARRRRPRLRRASPAARRLASPPERSPTAARWRRRRPGAGPPADASPPRRGGPRGGGGCEPAGSVLKTPSGLAGRLQKFAGPSCPAPTPPLVVTPASENPATPRSALNLPPAAPDETLGRDAPGAGKVMRLPDSVYQQVLQALGLDASGLLDRRGGGAAAGAPGGPKKRGPFRP